MSRGDIFVNDRLSKPSSSYYDLSHMLQTTGKFGTVIPMQVIDLIPGDKIGITPMCYIRLAPLISPAWTQLEVTIDVWVVPNRILWPEWDDFITGNEEIVPPYMVVNGIDWTDVALGSPWNTLGLPGYGDLSVWPNFRAEADAFPFIGYLTIWNEEYRNENLVDPVEWTLIPGQNAYVGDGSGLDPVYTRVLSAPQQRGWNPDYLTTALPWAQKGDPVQLPLVEDDFLDVVLENKDQTQKWENSAATPWGGLIEMQGTTTGVSQGYLPPIGPTEQAWLNPHGTLKVDPNVDAVTINQFRQALLLQEFLERDARGGTRIWETIWAHFGIRIKDYRVDKPEFVSRSRGNVNISEVLSSVVFQSGEEVVPQGTPTGRASAGTNGRYGSYFCTEFSYMHVLVNVQPKSAYQNFIERKWSRRTRYDYAWPTFARLGEQEVLKQEASFNWGDPSANANTFGYQRRYGEYMFINDRVSGLFTTSMDFWVLCRPFPVDQEIELNEQFVMVDQAAEDLDRIFAVQDGTDYIYIQLYLDISANRKIPIWNVPATLA